MNQYQYQYQAQQLSSLLNTIQKKAQSGTFHIKTLPQPDHPSRSRILVYHRGQITYGGSHIPYIPRLAQKLIKQFKPNVSKTTIEFVQQKTTNLKSAREFLQILCKLRVLTWEQIESYAQTQVAITLEQLLPYAGQIGFNPIVEFDIVYGDDGHCLNESKLKSELVLRQEQWSALAPTIKSMEAIPCLSKDGLEIISHESTRLHAQKYIDGKRSIVEIAQQSGEDPLELAQLYLTGFHTNWIVFEGTSTITNNKELHQLPTILSVDDSPIVQTMIKRALGDRYNVLLANNAIDALQILNNKTVDLLLLDVTMPVINGLEMCKTIRSIPKFRNLPIVMVTARDTLIDKMKGQIAGTNLYLTKPFDAEKLLAVVEQFLGNKKVIPV
ncbi:response regulator [Aphanothece sacrum]|uniref:Two-component response regulator n=1 Tax=Aphanothece sacrum FPU1 TaxID=1920663 RepID=A0A401IHR4_APHSA|nr:response regulator [Aphanothece sacrum]GBF80769.1 two-component response regulator [Aphanothece sacrum FPU1]GBF83264.1 two-component response regulator [Aphanothece sacrum FPU3]